MNSFSDANIAKAIDRVPVTSTADLVRQMETAKTRGIQNLVTAIEAEIAIRGPVKFDKASAEQHARWAEQVGDADVEEAIVIAFNELPIRDEESLLARQVAENPGISYQDLAKIRGKGDVGLILGHMIYERLGFFRRFVNGRQPPELTLQHLLTNPIPLDWDAQAQVLGFSSRKIPCSAQ